MTLGPLEYLVVGFRGSTDQFDGSVVNEIARVVESGTIRIVDLAFLYKDASGDAVVAEIDAKDDPRFAGFAGLLAGTTGLFTPEDLDTIAVDLPEETGALVVLFEHHWAVSIKEAMEAKGGFLIAREVIAPEILEELADELEAAVAGAA